MKADQNGWRLRKKQIYIVLCLLVLCLIVRIGLSEGKEGREPEELIPKEKTEGEEEDKQKKEQKSEQKSEQEPEKKGEDTMIRVLLRGNGFEDEVHSEAVIHAAGGIIIDAGGNLSETAAGEVLTMLPDHPLFQDGDRLCIQTLKRGYGNPVYRGVLELRAIAEGIAIVNELGLEEYLCAVVPSEMPAAYEMEALKCQAVCARSYAYNQIQTMAYPEYQALVDDSTSFQVYANSPENDRTNQAVHETRGMKIYYQNKVASAYYYSTSCGRTTDMSAWGEIKNQGNAYLNSVTVAGINGDYEKELPWYRWKAVMDKTTLGNRISLYTGIQIGRLLNLEITARGAGDVVVQIRADGTQGSAVVETENKIRRALGGEYYQIEKQDGTVVEGRELLPSAFFTIEDQGECIVLLGGGLGHGIGMSQNGANEMAKQGIGWKEILNTFYSGIEIRD